MKNNCKNCDHWKNKQSQLHYRDSLGFCTNKKFHFDAIAGTLVSVYDSHNVPTDRFPIHEIEMKAGFDKMPSRYKLTTEEEFGCNYFESKKKQ